MKHIYLSIGGKIFSELVPDNFWKQSKEDREIYITLTWPKVTWAGDAKENATIEHNFKVEKFAIIKERGGQAVAKASGNFAEFMRKQDAEIAEVEAKRKKRGEMERFINRSFNSIIEELRKT